MKTGAVAPACRAFRWLANHAEQLATAHHGDFHQCDGAGDGNHTGNDVGNADSGNQVREHFGLPHEGEKLPAGPARKPGGADQ